MTKKINAESKLIEELKESSITAFKEGNFLHSAIIIFQTVEFLLRIYISGLERGNGVSESVIKESTEKEISFSKLIMYFNIVYPKNDLSERLTTFNSQRNTFIHNLFYQEGSLKDISAQLEQFCIDGVELNRYLGKLIKDL